MKHIPVALGKMFKIKFVLEIKWNRQIFKM